MSRTVAALDPGSKGVNMRHPKRCSRVTLGLIPLFLIAQSLVPLEASARKGSAVECERAGQIVDRGSGWTSISAPEFPPWYQPIDDPAGTGRFPRQGFLSSFAVDAFNPNRMFVTDSRTVFRTVDGGCSWTEVYRVPNSAANGPSHSEIKQIVIPESPADDGLVYLTLVEYLAPVFDLVSLATVSPTSKSIAARASVLRSEDNGAEWVDWSQGLPARGTKFTEFGGRYSRALQIAPSNPDLAYLVLSAAGTTNGDENLYVRRPGDTSWSPVVSRAEGVQRSAGEIAGGNVVALNSGEWSGSAPAFLDIRIDPLDSNTLWKMRRNDTPQHSLDGGLTWTTPLAKGDLPGVSESAVETEILAIQHQPGQPARVLMDIAGSLFESTDGGQSFHQLDIIPGVSTGPNGKWFGIGYLTMGKADSILAYALTDRGATRNGELHRFDARSKRWGSKGPNYPVHESCNQTCLDGWTRDYFRIPSLYAMGPYSIERYTARF